MASSADVQVRAVDAGAAGRADALRRAAAQWRAMPDLAVTLALPGEHNVRNALAAIAVATELELPDAPIVAALAGFTGVDRRFQRYGEHPVAAANGGGSFTLVDDYGHHPAEMAAVLAAARGAFPAGASCSPSSRTATRARATASRTSSRCCRPPTSCS